MPKMQKIAHQQEAAVEREPHHPRWKGKTGISIQPAGPLRSAALDRCPLPGCITAYSNAVHRLAITPRYSTHSTLLSELLLLQTLDHRPTSNDFNHGPCLFFIITFLFSALSGIHVYLLRPTDRHAACPALSPSAHHSFTATASQNGLIRSFSPPQATSVVL